MTELELREKLMNLKDDLANIIANGEAEKRELSEEENSKMVSLRNQIEETEAEISALEEENRNL